MEGNLCMPGQFIEKSSYAKFLIVLALLSLIPIAAGAFEEPKTLLLWEDGAPGARGESSADQPSITVYFPPESTRTGAAVVVFPGGGYGHLAMSHEGDQVGRWLIAHGITGIVTKYRISPYHYPAPFLDAQRAIRMVRHFSSDWGIDPDRIGVMGFSAGGHLASTVATHFDSGDSSAVDSVAWESSRPDFAVLVYPVISFTTEFAHQGSLHNLLGASPDSELVRSLSNELQVTSNTPPTFLVATDEDTVVPAENSVLFFLALRKAHVPVEMHIFEPGQHGFGLAPYRPVLSVWPHLFLKWLQGSGFLSPSQPK